MDEKPSFTTSLFEYVPTTRTMAQNVSAPNSWIAEHLSGPQDKFVEFAQQVYENGTLDRKTKELIAVATASVDHCPHCTEGHIDGAKEAGASEEEIAEALAVLWVIGGGTNVVWNKEDFEEHLHPEPAEA